MSMSHALFRRKLAELARTAWLKDKGEIHAADGSWILSWNGRGNRASIAIEESPATSSKDPRRVLDPERKGKAVRWSADLWTPQDVRYPPLPNFLPYAKVTIKDSVPTLKLKLEVAWQKYLDLIRGNTDNSPDVTRWLQTDPEIDWYKNLQEPARFVPKSMKPIEIQGKGFKVTVKANEWQFYTKYDSHGGGDPFYTGYESASPAAARKLYLLIARSPDLLERFKTMDAEDFVSFLTANKIAYKHLSSGWR